MARIIIPEEYVNAVKDVVIDTKMIKRISKLSYDKTEIEMVLESSTVDLTIEEVCCLIADAIRKEYE